MSQTVFRRRWIEAPIAVQIVAMLIAGVVVGQVVVVAIVVLLPPPRSPIYRLSEIAAALKGQPARPLDGPPLVRRLGEPPAPSADPRHGAFVNDSRLELAALLGVGEDRVALGVDRPRFPFGPPSVWAFSPHRPRHRLEGGPPRGPDPGRGQEPPPGAGNMEPRPFFRPGAMGPDHGDVLFTRFEAALRQPSGGWIVVTPAPSHFPDPWQARVIAWFLGCLAVFGPASYLFARRLVRPITAFARAAERLGRDPRGELDQLAGPSEIGVAARAFNEMHARLKRYIEDRLSMIGAISHDLRTPLARIRFKLEAAPPAVREAVASDLDQMEAMISAALAFVRDAAHTPEREQLDLLSVLECVVDDARSTGADAHLIAHAPVVFEGDALALQRLFANLVDNAVKYGGRAEVRLFVEAGDAVIEVADNGPGLAACEMERVFEPFYRAERSRSRDTGGMGLGLAVARSIARGHGGDVALRTAASGLIAQVRLPMLSVIAKKAARAAI